MENKLFRAENTRKTKSSPEDIQKLFQSGFFPFFSATHTLLMQLPPPVGPKPTAQSQQGSYPAELTGETLHQGTDYEL